MAHPSRNSLETLKQETEPCDVTFQGGAEVTHPPAASWNQGCPSQGHSAKWMMEVLQDRGAEAQHFTSDLEVSAAEPESLRRKEEKTFQKGTEEERKGCSCWPQWSVSCHRLLPSAAGPAQAAESTSPSVALLSCDLNKALDGNKTVVFL